WTKQFKTFMLCGSTKRQYYEILLGTCEIINKSKESLMICFENLISIPAKVTKLFLMNTYNCINEYIRGNSTIGKKAYRLLEKKTNYEKIARQIRKNLEYSCVAHIGSKISKMFKTVRITHQQRPLMLFAKIKHKIQKEKGKIGIKLQPNITSIAGNGLYIYNVICQDILYTYSELLEFSNILNAHYEICQIINSMLQCEETMNTIIFTAYLHEMFVYPIITAEKIKNKYGEKSKTFAFSRLNVFELINNVKTVDIVRKSFIEVYEKIFEKEDRTYSYKLKSYTNIISERVFAQIKRTLQNAPNKKIIMRCAQISAAHNKMHNHQLKLWKKETRKKVPKLNQNIKKKPIKL
uniref:Uncharacterized protein n=1 Tax=Strongyloides stercoralis TaxID=6248 RepID=A0AAF5DKD5_STRER